jgi:hypothetical protein
MGRADNATRSRSCRHVKTSGQLHSEVPIFPSVPVYGSVTAGAMLCRFVWRPEIRKPTGCVMTYDELNNKALNFTSINNKC